MFCGKSFLGKSSMCTAELRFFITSEEKVGNVDEKRSWGRLDNIIL